MAAPYYPLMSRAFLRRFLVACTVGLAPIVCVHAADDVGDDAAGALSVSLGVTNARLGHDGDVDVFKVPLLAGKHYSFAAEGNMSLKVALYAPDETALTPFLMNAAALTASVDGQYYVAARAYMSFDTGYYQLTITERAADDHANSAAGVPAEDHFTPADFDIALDAQFEFPGDVDAFLFTGDADGVYQFSAGNNLIAIYAPDGTMVDAATSGAVLPIPAVGPAGPYVLKVFSQSTGTSDYTLAGAPLLAVPDMAGTSLTVTALARETVTVDPGDSIPITAVFTNQGTGNWPEDRPVLVDTYLSLDEVLDDGDTKFGWPIYQWGLLVGPGDTVAASDSQMIPHGTPAGSYYVLAEINHAEDQGDGLPVRRPVYETNETNNVVSGGATNVITVNPKDYPDLVVIDVQVSLPTRAFVVGEESAVDVTWTVQNQGAIATDSGGAGWLNRIGLTSDPDFGKEVSDEMMQHEGGGGGIADVVFEGDLDPVGGPGDSAYTLTQRVTLPLGQDGALYLYVQVDVSDPYVYWYLSPVIEGAGETNNARLVELDITPAPRPDLIIQSIQLEPPVNDDYEIGGDIVAQVTVQNQGQAATLADMDFRGTITDDAGTQDLATPSFTVDDRMQYGLGSGDADWPGRNHTYGPFDPGLYTFVWSFDRNEWSQANLEDSVWVDQVSFTDDGVVIPFTAGTLPNGWETDALNGWAVDTGNNSPADTDAGALRSGPTGKVDRSQVWVVRELTEATSVSFLSKLSTGGWSSQLNFRVYKGDIRLPAGARSTVTFDVVASVPPNASQAVGDNRRLALEVDSNDAIFEGYTGGEFNNTAVSDSFTIIQRSPDLVITNLTDPVGGISGQNVTITFDVTNLPPDQGVANLDFTGTSFPIRITYSTDGVLFTTSNWFPYVTTGTIAVGETKSTSTVYTIPRGDLSGYLRIELDPTNQVGELGLARNNNVATTGQLTFVKPTAPDLVPLIDAQHPFTLPDTLIPGQSFAYEWTTANVAPGDAAATHWYDDIHLSADDQFDRGTDFLLVRGGHDLGQLNVGESYTFSGSATMGSLAPGDYYVFLNIDNLSFVTEKYDEFFAPNNNIYMRVDDGGAPRKVRVPALDLEPVSLTMPTLMEGDVPVSISWGIRNNGDMGFSAGRWVAERLYLSTNSVFGDGDDQLWRTDYFNSAIPAGATTPHTVSGVTLPAGLAPGLYYVFLQTDYGNSYQEYAIDGTPAEDNNVYRRPSAVQIMQPDLIVRSLTWAPGAVLSRGTSVDVTVTLKNANAGVASAGWYDQFYAVAADDTATSMGTFSHSVDLGDLAPGTERTYTATLNVPNSLAIGTYRLKVVADAGGVVSEGNEGNNFRVTTGTLPAVGSDLTVVSADAPGTVRANTAFELHYSLLNRGAGATPKSWADKIYVSDSATYGSRATVYTAVLNHSSSVTPPTAPLAAGGTGNYTIASVYIAETTPVNGNSEFYLHIVTDANDGLNEYHDDGQAETNNVWTSSAIKLGTFDLVVTTPADPAGTDALGTAEEPWHSGDTAVTVQWRVENQGSDSVSGPWVDRLYLSTNTVESYTYGDVFLAEVNGPDLLAGNSAFYDRTATIDVPEWRSEWDAAGAFYLKVMTDAGGRLDELNDGEDNVGVYNVHFSKAPAVDLRVVSVDVPPAPVYGGVANPITFTLANDGEIAALGKWYDYLYLREGSSSWSRQSFRFEHGLADTTWGTQGGYYTETVSIPAGRHTVAWVFTRKESYSVPPNSARLDNINLPGIGTIDFETGQTLAELGFESGVKRDGSPQWQIGPQAEGGNEVATGSIAVGQSFVLMYTGTFAEGDLTFDLNPDAHLLSFHTDYAIPPGESRSFTFSPKFYGSLSGDYKLELDADSSNTFKEPGREDNNEGESDVFAIAAPPHPDLEVISVALDPPGTILTTGAVTTVQWTVRNNLSFDAGAPATGYWQDRVYLSDDAVLDGADEQLTYVWRQEGQVAGGLAVNQTYTGSVSFRLDDGPGGGTKYILATTDGSNSVFEGTMTANNTLVSAELTVQRGAYPDLLPIELAVPSAINNATDMTTYWRVENVGDGMANATWSEAVYLSTTANADVSADGESLLAIDHTAQNFPPSQEGQPSIYTEVGEIPISRDVPGGTYYLKLLVDADDVLFEYADDGTEDTNNVFVSAPFEITVAPIPNLTVSKVTLEMLGRRDSTQLQVDVAWTVGNTGTGATGNKTWSDAIYLSTTPNTYGEKMLLATVPNQSYLEPGQSYTQQTELTIPWEFAEGDYYAVVVTDSKGQVDEHHGENDNTNVSTDATGAPVSTHVPFIPEPRPYPTVLSSFAGDAEYPDVTQTPPEEGEGDIVVHTPVVTTGQRVSASWTTKNTGDAAMTANRSSWDDGWALSKDPFYDADDFWLGSHNYHPLLLAVGEFHRLEKRVSEAAIPLSLPSGKYYLLIVANTHSALWGMNYRGNTGIAPRKVNVRQAPPPDLTLLAGSFEVVTPPEQRVTQEPLQFRWRVENRGWSRTRERSWNDTVTLIDAGDVERTIAQVYHSGALDIVPTPETASGSWFYEASASSWVISESLLPSGASQASFRVRIDIGDSVFEGNEVDFPNGKLNNTFELPAPIVITRRQAPDLTPTALSVITPADQLRRGGRFEVEWSVRNVGPVSTLSGKGGWRDQLVLLDGNGNQVGPIFTKSYEGERLKAGLSYTRRGEFVLPESESVPEQLQLALKVVMYETEDNTGNNTYHGPSINLPFKQRPDLKVTSAAILTPGPYYPGTSLTLSYTVANVGEDTWADQRYWQDDITLSSDSVLGNSDDRRANYHSRQNGLLGTAGTAASDEQARYTVEKKISLSPDTAGTWYLFVTADAASRVGELNEYNNVLASPLSFTITARGFPDLQVSAMDLSQTQPLIAPDVQQVPATVLSGQTVTGMTFTVTNEGDHTTPDLTWSDTLYLSRDRILDSADPRVGYTVHSGALDANASYTQPESPGAKVQFTIPEGMQGSYYLIVKTDTGSGSGQVYEKGREGNNVRASDSPFIIRAPSPNVDPAVKSYIDLQVANVVVSLPRGREDIPVQPGQSFSASWRVVNAGTADLPSSAWRDGVYISADDTWSTEDAFVGAVDHVSGLAAGAYITHSQSFMLPPVNEGDYYVIVRTDIRQNVPEPFLVTAAGTQDMEQNNAATAATDNLVRTDLPRLHIEDDVNDTDPPNGVTHQDQVTGTMDTEKEVHYRVDLIAGQDLLVNLVCDDTTSAMELFLRMDEVASPLAADFVFTDHFRNEQTIIVPGTRDGSLYIMARGDNVPNGPANYTLTVKYLKFEVTAVTPEEAGNAGAVTLTITGAKFSPASSPKLIGPTGQNHAATEIHFHDPGTLYATFDLKGVSTGNYDVAIENPDSRMTALREDALSVGQGSGGHLTTKLTLPNAVRPGTTHFAWVEYGNDGDADIPAPLLYVRTTDGLGVNFRLLPGDPWREGSVQVLGVNRDGPTDRLPPGAEFAIPISYRIPTTGQFDFHLWILDTIPDSLDWDELEAELVNTDADDSEQEAMLEYLHAHFGTTYSTFAGGLRADALRLWRQGDEVHDVRDLIHFAAARGYENDISALSGFLRDQATGSALGNIAVFLRTDDEELYDTVTDGAGAFSFTELPPGAYTLYADGYLFDEPIVRELTYDTDAIGILATGFVPHDSVVTGHIPNPLNDSSPSMARLSDGTLQVAWSRGGQVWHAVWDDATASWRAESENRDGPPVEGLAVPGAQGIDPRIVPLTSEDAAATGADFVLSWRHLLSLEDGLNGSKYRYALGRESDPAGRTEWTAVQAATDGSYGDTGFDAISLRNGELMSAFLQRDWALDDDDTDLYCKLVTLPTTLDFLPGGRNLMLDPERGLREIEGGSTHSIAFEMAAKTTVPSGVPLIAGTYGFDISGALKLALKECEVEAEAALGAKMEVGDSGAISGSAAMSASWKANKKSCSWAFNQGKLSLGIGGEISVPGYVNSIGIAKVSAGLTLQGDGKLNVNYYGSGPGAKGSRMNAEFSVGGGPYGQVTFFKEWLEAEINGIATIKGAHNATKGLHLTGWELKLAASIKGWFTTYTYEKTWSDSFRGGRANGLYRELLDEDTYCITTVVDSDGVHSVETFTQRRTVPVGTGGDYSEDGAVSLEALAAIWDDPADPADDWDGVGDGAPTIAANSDGSEVLLAWAKESGNTIRKTGTFLKLAQFGTIRGNDSGWTLLDDLTDATYYSRNPVLVFDDTDTPWVFWVRSNVTVKLDDPMDKLLEAMEDTDIFYSYRDSGQWVSPVRLEDVAGRDGEIAVSAADNGDILVAWVNRPGDAGSEVILTKTYNASTQTWSAAENVSTPPPGRAELEPVAVSSPAAGHDADDTPVLVWAHTVNGGTALEEQTVATTMWDGAAWTAFALFTKPVAATGRGDDESVNTDVDAVLDRLPCDCGTDPELLADSSTRDDRFSISPPWAVPEKCCKKDDKPKPKPKPKPEPPDPKPPAPGGGGGGGSGSYTSSDPNEKHGPQGVGDTHMVSLNAPLNYTIMFENKKTAGPASVVRVTDVLEAGLDISRFRLREFAFGDTVVEVRGNSPFHFSSMELDNGMVLNLFGTIDPVSSTAIWEFTTLDPDTGAAPDDPLLGFLPPNDDNHSGEGHVTFTILPDPNSTDGTVVRNQATIVFDVNDAIVTNVTTHTISRVVYESTVGIRDAEGSYEAPRETEVVEFDGTLLAVSWGTSGGSATLDIDPDGAGYDVYYAVGDGPYTLWQSATKKTTASLEVVRGLTYRFYSLARDAAGNSEDAPTEPDLIVRVLHANVTFSGEARYDGKATGTLRVVLAAQDKVDRAPATQVDALAGPGSFAFPMEGGADLPGEGTLYALSAFVDTNANGLLDSFEPQTPTSAEWLDPVGSAPALTVNLVLADVDADTDGLPDWWEQFYFGNLASGAYDDPDSDGVPNRVEYARRTDPADGGATPVKLASTGAVSIKDGLLLVDGAEFAIQGVLYRPYAPEASPDTLSNPYSEAALARDIPLLVALGANTVRIPFVMAGQAVLDACADAGLMVIADFPVEPSVVTTGTDAEQQTLALAFEEYVTALKDHPALLMWCVGPDVRAALTEAAAEDRGTWDKLLSLLAWLAADIQGDAYHPVTSVSPFGGADDIGGLDLWGFDLTGVNDITTRQTLLDDIAATVPGDAFWISGFGVSAWDQNSGMVSEPLQAETALDFADAIAESAPTAGSFQDGDTIVYSGTVQDVVAGDAASVGLAFKDIDGDGRRQAGEAIWADRLISIRGRFESLTDTVIDAAGIGTPSEGAEGIQAGVFFHDANTNGQWDLGEDVWSDTDLDGALPRVYDNHQFDGETVADALIYHGGLVDVVDGTPGPQLSLFYVDADVSGGWTTGEPLWFDQAVAEAGRYDAAYDELVPGTGTPADGDPGVTTGIYFADSAIENGAWDPEEDVWTKTGERGAGGVYTEFMDQWWTAGLPAQQDDVAEEYAGLFSNGADGPQLRLAYLVLQQFWAGDGESLPTVLDTNVTTQEDQLVTFAVRAYAGPEYEFVLRRPGGGYHGTVGNWEARGGLASVTYTPSANFAGADRIDYDVVETGSGTVVSEGVIIVQVRATEDPPTTLATDPDTGTINALEGQPLTVQLSVEEIDGDPVSFAVAVDGGGALTGASISDPVYDEDSELWVADFTWTPSYDTASRAQPDVDLPVVVSATDVTTRATIQLNRTIRVSNVNRAPLTPSSVTMGPTQVVSFVTEDLSVAAWDYQDPDGDLEDAADVTIRWYRQDGRAALTSFDNVGTIPAGSLIPGDVVYCEISPSDGDLAAAAPGRSPDITILNGIQSIGVTPALPRTGDSLAYALTWAVAYTGDVGFDIAWELGGAPAGTGDTVHPTRTARGQQWTVTATAYADLAAHARHDAPPRSVTFSIVDTPPSVPRDATYSVALPQAGEDVAVLVTNQAPDADGDAITWETEWSATADFANPQVGDALGSAVTAHGDVWYSRVRAVADDGQRGTAYSDWLVLDPLRVGLGVHMAELYTGWNLLAFPVQPVDDFATDAVDEATVPGLLGAYILGILWSWDPGSATYVPLLDGVDGVSPIVAMHGFWGFYVGASDRDAGTATDVSVLGWRADREAGEETLLLQPGWNLIGVAADLTEPPAWYQNPMISWPLWTWESSGRNGSYRGVSYLGGDPDDQLKAGKGYWVYILGNQPISLDLGPE